MVNDKKEPREDKDKRIIGTIEDLEPGEFASLKDLQVKSGVRDVTIEERLDTYDTFKSVEFDTVRHKKGIKEGKVRGILRTEGENLTVEQKLENLEKDTKEIKNSIKELKNAKEK